MKMTRHFFVSDDLDDLERFEEELEATGFVTPQIHVLSLDDTAVASHNRLHSVVSLMRRDIIHSTLIGAGVGLCVSVLILLVAHFAGWTQSPAGWLPFVFLAVIALGFFTWEGGLWGIQQPNVHFKKFEGYLKAGRHVFFVDMVPGRGQRKILAEVVKNHPSISASGVDEGAPHWVVFWQHRLKRFFTESFP